MRRKSKRHIDSAMHQEQKKFPGHCQGCKSQFLCLLPLWKIKPQQSHLLSQSERVDLYNDRPQRVPCTITSFKIRFSQGMRK